MIKLWQLMIFWQSVKMKELIKFKNSLVDEFDALKSSFFAEANSFKQ